MRRIKVGDRGGERLREGLLGDDAAVAEEVGGDPHLHDPLPGDVEAISMGAGP